MESSAGNAGQDYGSPLVRAEPMLWKATLLFLAGIGALVYFRPFERAAIEPDRPLLLRATDQDARLRLRWDPALRAVRDAESAKIDVLDGGSVFEYPLVRESLLQGSFEYARRTDDVVATLRLYQGGRESKFAVLRSFGQTPVIEPEPRRRIEQSRNRAPEAGKRKARPAAGERKSQRRR